MRRTAALLLLFVFAAMLPAATVLGLAAPQQLLPVCCRAHGAHSCVMGMPASDSTGLPAVRRPACPFAPSLRAITTVTITGDFSSCSSFALAVRNIKRQYVADAVATLILSRSVPRGPPSRFSI